MTSDTTKRGSAWILPAAMLLGGVLGVVIGTIFGSRWSDPGYSGFVTCIRLLGVVFLSLLKALVVPLIATSICIGVSKLGSAGVAARVAAKTATYFLVTTLFAVLVGIFWVQVIHPGTAGSANIAEASPVASRTPMEVVADLVTNMFPPNLAAAAVEANVLGLVVFSLLLGAAMARLGEKAHPVIAFCESLNEVLLLLVRWIVWLAPLGILGLVADRIGRGGGGDVAWTELKRLGAYALTVLVGLATHALITLPLLLKLFAKRSPIAYARGMMDALVTAFGTASSAATMAVTLRCTTERNGVSPRAANIVVPLGTTVNMDGTALYEAVAVIFVAQTLGVDLDAAKLALIALTATLAAVGAAAIPEAGLVTMVLVLEAVGLPAESVGLLLSIDWILDRFRTSINVWGDSVGAAIIDRRLDSPS